MAQSPNRGAPRRGDSDEETLGAPGRGDSDEETLGAPGRGGKGWGDPLRPP